jgi:D-alanine-D-alanine ligase
MRITVLAYQEPDDPGPDVVVEQVAEALKAAGHTVETFALTDDVGQLVAGLRERRPELIFNVMEGFGDDIVGGLMGVNGVLDLLEIPYTGGGPGEIYLQEDKALSKKLLSYENILYPDFASFAPNADFETGGKLRMPLFVKPLRMDGSVGIDGKKSFVKTAQELMERVLQINKELGDAALAEEYIDGREFYVGILGNLQPQAFVPIEVDFTGFPEGAPKVLDRKAKWDENSPEFKGTKSKIATDLEPELKAKLQKTALEAYRALRVRDYGRIDMRLTESGEIYVIEVNASCYLENSSEFAMSAAADGVEYPQLINRIVELALERDQVKPKSRPKAR